MTDLAFGVVVGATFFGISMVFGHLVSHYRARPSKQLHEPRLLALAERVERDDRHRAKVHAMITLCDLHDIGGDPKATCDCSPQKRALHVGPPSGRCTHGATHCNTCGW